MQFSRAAIQLVHLSQTFPCMRHALHWTECHDLGADAWSTPEPVGCQMNLGASLDLPPLCEIQRLDQMATQQCWQCLYIWFLVQPSLDSRLEVPLWSILSKLFPLDSQCCRMTLSVWGRGTGRHCRLLLVYLGDSVKGGEAVTGKMPRWGQGILGEKALLGAV